MFSCIISLIETNCKYIYKSNQYPIHSLLVFNSDKKAIPVAWIIAPRFSSLDAHRWMRALYNRVHTKDPTWKLDGFIVDDPLYNVLTIRLAIYIFSIFLLKLCRLKLSNSISKKKNECIQKKENFQVVEEIYCSLVPAFKYGACEFNYPRDIGYYGMYCKNIVTTAVYSCD